MMKKITKVKNVKRILVITLSNIGDVILTTPTKQTIETSIKPALAIETDGLSPPQNASSPDNFPVLTQSPDSCDSWRGLNPIGVDLRGGTVGASPEASLPSSFKGSHGRVSVGDVYYYNVRV